MSLSFENLSSASSSSSSSSGSSLLRTPSPPHESPSPVNSPENRSYSESEALDFFFADSHKLSRALVVCPLMGETGRAGEIASILTKPKIQKIAYDCSIPNHIRMAAPRPTDRVSAPPLGFVAVYEHGLKCGLRLPLPSVYAEFLNHFGISISQLMPNSFRQLIALGVAVGRQGAEMSLSLIIRFFQLKRSSGWFYLTPRLGFKAKTKSKIARWQEKFFFCSAEEAGVPQIPWRNDKVEEFEVRDGFGDLEDHLISLGVVDEEYSEAELASWGLSPYDPAVKGEAPLRTYFAPYFLMLNCH